MPGERNALLDALSGAKTDAREQYDRAVNAVLNVAWSFRNEEFQWEDYPELNDRVNEILRDLSDECIEDAEVRARDLLRRLDLDDWEDESLQYAMRGTGEDSVLFRLDMQASHLKELLAGWLITAAISGLSIARTRVLIYSYMNSPSASEEWRGAGLAKPGWGSGYAVNVLNGMAVIMQDMINAAYQYAKQEGFRRDGAVGYRIERGSDYDCPLCDSYVGPVYPVGEMILPIHPRCVCIPVPVYENEQ